MSTSRTGRENIEIDFSLKLRKLMSWIKTNSFQVFQPRPGHAALEICCRPPWDTQGVTRSEVGWHRNTNNWSKYIKQEDSLLHQWEMSPRCTALVAHWLFTIPKHLNTHQISSSRVTRREGSDNFWSNKIIFKTVENVNSRNFLGPKHPE